MHSQAAAGVLQAYMSLAHDAWQPQVIFIEGIGRLRLQSLGAVLVRKSTAASKIMIAPSSSTHAPIPIACSL
jgi:hypothetical protein